MRVVVACDATAGLSPRAASEAVAGAFAREGATVAVVPLGADGSATLGTGPSGTIPSVSSPQSPRSL